MNRRRIEASEIFSLPEAISLDTLTRSYPGSVEASLFGDDGDLYLRIASSKSEETDGMTEKDIQKKIEEWRKYARENATNAGFRKANKGRGPMDPRRFALQLSEAAKLNANRYGSLSLLRLARRLRWVAGQERGVAARALAKMAAPSEEEARRRDQTGMPVIQKPQEQAILPSSEFNEESRLTPGAQIEFGQDRQDQSWRARESGRIAKEKEIDSELTTLARNFLLDYKARNSFYDDDLLDQIDVDNDVFTGWTQDLDNQGVKPTQEQLADAWNAAMNEIAEGEGKPLSDELEGEEEPAPVSATRGGEITDPQNKAAPGGDWFNTVVNMFENPTMDRYIRTMKDKREGRGRVSRKIEVESEIAEAVDQTLDFFSGDMLPSEISSDHVRKFIEDKFSDVDWEKVYEAIQKISDPRKRHDDDPKERTNKELSSRARVRPRSPERTPEMGRREEGRSYGKSGLKRYRNVCACCHGTGEKGERCCGQCRGSGQTDANLLDEDRDRTEKIAAKLGTLLVVSVDAGNRLVSSAGRQELARVTRVRVASKGAPLVLKHSTELMKILVENDIPYRTASYRHPRYQR